MLAGKFTCDMTHFLWQAVSFTVAGHAAIVIKNVPMVRLCKSDISLAQQSYFSGHLSRFIGIFHF